MNLHLHHHFPQELVERLFKTLHEISSTQGIIMSAIDSIKAALAAQADALNKETLAIKSVVAGLDGIKGQLDAALAGGAGQAELQAIADQISAHTAQLNASTDLINGALIHDVAQITGTPSTDASGSAANSGAPSTDTSSAASTDAASAGAAADTSSATAATETGSASAAASTSTDTGTATTASAA